MTCKPNSRHILGGLCSVVILACGMGQGCLSFDLFSDTTPVYDDVTVELVNTTNDFIDPYLFVDPFTVDDPLLMAIPENLVDIGDPLAPLEMATLTFTCEEAGTLYIDGDLLLTADTAIVLDNPVLLQEGGPYFCGDIVSIYYSVDTATDLFFTSIDVNDVPLPCCP